jgi:SAM-dependent methyltransferase
MDFTGERYIPTTGGAVHIEHMHRYALSMKFAASKDILDIACGEGYGSNLLAQTARSVTGVDISPEAVAHANAQYGSKANLKFLVGSCDAIPVETSSIDLVVSFETIEHHAQHREMMLEIMRVLREDGLLLISSPDKLIYSDGGRQINPYHVKELSFSEFSELLRRHFKTVVFCGQRLATASFVYPMSENVQGYSAYTERQGTLELGGAPLSRSLYHLALCSKSNAALVPEASVYLNHDIDLFVAFVRESMRCAELQAELSKIKALLDAKR